MKWLELSVSAPAEFVEPLSQIFHRYGHRGVVLEEEGGYNPDEGEGPPAAGQVTVRTYIPLNAATQDRRSRIDLGVRLVAHVGPISALQEKILAEEEWENSWKRHFHPLRIGRRLLIAPAWVEYSPRPKEVVISIDTGMAFGTGHHPTTRMCLEQLETLVKPGMDILDVGCGSAVLSIAAAKLGARSALGLEIDQTAVGVAKKNVRVNGGEPSIRIEEGSLPHPDARTDGFDIAVANISAKVVSEIAINLVACTRPSGKVVASGILQEKSSEVQDALVQAGAVVDEVVVDGDWVTIVASVP